MKNALLSLMAAALVTVSFQPAFADAPTMPTCATGDATVGANMVDKTYMTMAQMKTATTGMTDAQKQDMMTKNHMSMMCMSKAVAAGMKPMVNVTNSSVPGSNGYSGSAPAPAPSAT